MALSIERTDLADDKTRSLIDVWLARQPGSTIFHTTDWNLIVQDTFGTACQYFLAFDHGKLVGVLPCHFVKQSPWTTVCYSPPRIYEVSYGGPVAMGVRSAQVCKSLVKAAAHARIGVAVSIFNSPQNTEWVTLTGWKKVTAFEGAYVDLEPSLDEIWTSSLNGKRRNMIRKAEKTGVQIQDLGRDGLDQYYDLVEQTAARADLHLKPKSYYLNILATFGRRDQARLLLAFHDGSILAGGIFLRYQTTAYYWVGATASHARNLGQGELLQWRVIQWAKESGCRWYDLVGVERERLPHIARFKLGFTNHIVPFHHVGYATLLSRVIRRIEGSLWRKR